MTRLKGILITECIYAYSINNKQLKASWLENVSARACTHVTYDVCTERRTNNQKTSPAPSRRWVETLK